ncbi:MAG: hypothetical protein LBD52_07515 [Prevotellaceae bacterium]|jgi:hypothetical protein|nr:hypothetical protein [Prevotellaceae bacterium]
MAALTKAQLKTLSNNTFFDNDQGEIEPSEHRAFNDVLIDTFVNGATLNGNDVPVNEEGKLEITFNDITTVTFIVDSNDALAAWANNTEGNDYSHVLIKAGTWTSSKEVNLTTAGTKVVVGQAGSSLSFTSSYGLRYNSKPTTADYWMFGVTVNISGSTYGYGFSNCTYLTNCSGTGTSDNATGSGSGYGFSNCTYLTNCTGTGTGSTYGYGFYNCTYLTNCTGSGTGTSDNATGSGYGYGFSNCTYLTNCSGTGTARSSSTGGGYGFNGCRIMMFCKPGSTASTSATYSSCYMHASGTTDPVADTAAGGWNRS